MQQFSQTTLFIVMWICYFFIHSFLCSTQPERPYDSFTYWNFYWREIKMKNETALVFPFHHTDLIAFVHILIKTYKSLDQIEENENLINSKIHISAILNSFAYIMRWVCPFLSSISFWFIIFITSIYRIKGL